MLVVTAPARAALLDAPMVVVSGTASDLGSGVASVSVNGVAAEVAAGGSFQAELALEGGVALIDVVARDGAGNEAHDVRAVLAGPRSQEGVIANGLVARIAPGGYGFLADAVTAGLAASDLGGAAPQGALMGVPDCFEVNLAGLQHGAIDVDLEPRAGGVGVALAVHDVVLDLRVDMGGFCDPEGSSAPARLRADTLWLRGLARLGVSGGGVTPDLSGLTATFDGVDLDTTGLPSQVINLLISNAPSELAGALGDAIGPLAGGAIGESLASFDALAWSPTTEGLGLTVRLSPTAVDAGMDGLVVTASVELDSGGLGPVEYVTGAGPAQALPPGGGSVLRLGVSDDVANLALATLSAGGFLDRSVSVPDDSAARTLLGLDHLDLELQLPPMVTSREGSAHIVVGDALITAYDLEGDAVMRLAASAEADLALSSGDGGALLTLLPDQAQLWLSPVGDDGASSRAIDLPEPLRLAALDQLTHFLGDSIASLPVPDTSGVARVSSLQAVPGYVVLDADPVAP